MAGNHPSFGPKRALPLAGPDTDRPRFSALQSLTWAMANYVPPLRDIRFVLEQLVDLDGLSRLEAYGHADPDTVFGVIEESGRFVADVVGPLNQPGDAVGSTLDGEGRVTTPPGVQRGVPAVR